MLFDKSQSRYERVFCWIHDKSSVLSKYVEHVLYWEEKMWVYKNYLISYRLGVAAVKGGIDDHIKNPKSVI